MLKGIKQDFIRIVILLLILVYMSGCSPKTVIENNHLSPAAEKTQPSVTTHSKALTQSETAEQFVKNQGYKIYMNSGNYANIQLPSTFAAKRNGIAIGDLLKQINEQSKQRGLDFSGYLGKEVTLYTYGVESKQVISEKVDIMMDKNKVIGFWTDTHTEPPDFNVIVSVLNSNECE